MFPYYCEGNLKIISILKFLLKIHTHVVLVYEHIKIRKQKILNLHSTF